MSERKDSRAQEPRALRSLTEVEWGAVSGGADPGLKERMQAALKSVKIDAQIRSLNLPLSV